MKAERLIPILEGFNPGNTEEISGQGGHLPSLVHIVVEFLAATAPCHLNETIRIGELGTDRVNTAADDLQDIEREMPQLREQIAAAEDVARRIEIRAPLGGRVVDLKVHTLGGVIGQGEPLLDIVPDSERLLIDAQIDPYDIDMVRAGQAAEVRFTAFHQRELRPLAGRLISLSADRMVEEKTGRAYYLERIELTEDPGVVQKGAEVVPGMQADAIILTGESTLFGYLKRPIERTFERALRED